MRHGVRIVTFAALVFFISSPAWARQVTSSISGVVKDSAGGVVPGAMVVVTNPDTGAKFDAITNSTGTFNVPALPTGRYTVTVSLQGFKTTVLSDVRVQAGVPANVTATLEVGGLQETVMVKSEATELINTRTATVTSTLNADQIAQLPTPTRDLLLGGVTMLVGVNFTGIGARQGHGQRPAGVVPEHHAGRREQQRQLQQVHGRVLRARAAAAGRHRSRDGHDGRGRRGRGRPRRRLDQLHDALGHESLHGQRVRVLPRYLDEHQLLVQQERRQPAQRGAAEPVRGAHRRADRDSRRL